MLFDFCNTIRSELGLSGLSRWLFICAYLGNVECRVAVNLYNSVKVLSSHVCVRISGVRVCPVNVGVYQISVILVLIVRINISLPVSVLFVLWL